MNADVKKIGFIAIVALVAVAAANRVDAVKRLVYGV